MEEGPEDVLSFNAVQNSRKRSTTLHGAGLHCEDSCPSDEYQVDEDDAAEVDQEFEALDDLDDNLTELELGENDVNARIQRDIVISQAGNR